MTAYAFEGGVSRDFAPGMIQISEEQYRGCIDGMSVGLEVTIDGGFSIRERSPSPDHVWESGVWVLPPVEPEATTANDVIVERERRLAAGLVFDFGDERGVHVIGTTAEDMKRWIEEVTPLATAMVNSGIPQGEITLLTNTAPVVVTAAEWQQILLAAGQARQPIYAASFMLQTMNPIPEDFAADIYWP